MRSLETISHKESRLELIVESFGDYQTNCYIIRLDGGELIIDPGIGATGWVIEQCKNPLAILNTHGHFDHVWSNAELQKHFANIPLIVPEGDLFMLESDCFDTGLSPSKPTRLIKGDETIMIGPFSIQWRHFPGHTPGCSTIEVGEGFFSGDFIFKNSIGRSDFPYSSPQAMQKSLERFATIPYDKPLFAGHGAPSTIKKEQDNVPFWIERI